MKSRPSDPQLISLIQAAATLPKTDGKTFSTNAVWRWCRKGVKSRTGGTIRLEHVRLGGKIYTTTQWLTEFGKKLAEADAEYFKDAEQNFVIPKSLDSPRRSAAYLKRRQAQIAQAEKELRDMGV